MLISRAIKRVLSAALALISGASISGCNIPFDGGAYGPPSLYGPVRGNLIITGNISQEDGTPISGVHVTVRYPNQSILWDDVVSGADGAYDFRAYRYAADGVTVTITATDEDGPANGGDFAGASKTVEVPPVAQGSTASFDVDFILDPKQ